MQQLVDWEPVDVRSSHCGRAKCRAAVLVPLQPPSFRFDVLLGLPGRCERPPQKSPNVYPTRPVAVRADSIPFRDDQGSMIRIEATADGGNAGRLRAR